MVKYAQTLAHASGERKPRSLAVSGWSAYHTPTCTRCVSGSRGTSRWTFETATRNRWLPILTRWPIAGRDKSGNGAAHASLLGSGENDTNGLYG